MKAATVAVVDADGPARDALAAALTARGYSARAFATAGRFFDSLIEAAPRAAFVSMELPGMDGREVIRVLRANPETKGMVLVAVSRGRRRREEVVAGFEAGADEFLEAPFDAAFIMVRLESLLRGRPEAAAAQVLELDGLVVDLDARGCRLGGKAVALTRLEFDLLEHFLRHRGRVLTRGALLSALWRGAAPSTRTVDKHIESLRRKLAAFGSRLQTIVNVGYCLK